MRWLALVLWVGRLDLAAAEEPPAATRPGAANPAREPGPGSIRLAGDADYAPIEYLEDGQPRGLLLEILAALEGRTDLRFEVELVEWQEAQRRAQAREVDAIGFIAITDARLELYDFTRETIELTYSLFVHRDDLTIHQIEDVRGKRVAVTPGGYPRQLLGGMPGVELVLVPSYLDGFARLLGGEVEAVAGDTWVGTYALQRLQLHGVRVAPMPFAALRAGFAVPKGDASTLARLNDGLALLRASGELDRILSSFSAQEVVYVTRARVQAMAAIAAGALALLAALAGSLWIVSLRRQVQRKTLLLREANDRLEARVSDRTRELQRSEERWRLLLQTAPVLVVVLDTDNRVLEFNAEAERVFGVTTAEARGVNYLERFIAPENRPGLRQPLDHLDRGLRLEGFENEILAAGGLRRFVTWNACQLPATGGEPARVLGVGFDVTERRRDLEARRLLEEQLRQAETLRTIGQLAGGVAHDFNNQLVGIISFASLLLPRQATDEDREACEMILRAARTSSALTRQLLTFARKGKPRMEPLDVHVLLREAVTFFRGSLPKAIEIDCRFEADCADVVGDAPLLQSSFLNLAVNARDAMPEGGRFTVSTRIEERGGAHVLAVSFADTGAGMNPDTRRRIFEPFFTTKEDGRGTGMGLPLVQGTVESHGGTIEVASEEGRGTIVTLALPLVPRSSERPAAPALALSRLVGAPRILLVDDDPFVRNATTLVLRSLGGQVTPCEDGRAAVELVGRTPVAFDVVLMDLDMPVMSGREAMGALRALRPDLKVVFASGYAGATTGAPDASPAAVPSAAIEKPFEPQALAHVLNEVLAVKA